MAKIRVLIVDDHDLVREGIRLILGRHDDIEVAGEAANGEEAIKKVRQLLPDVALMDIAMPGLGGLEATLEIKKISPRTKVLVLTQYEDIEYIYRFLKAGAAGYVLKKAAGHQLLSAIRAVHSGGSFLDPTVAPQVIQGYLGERQKQTPENEYDRLTDRERQVLKLVAEGYTSKQIADLLCLSIKTVMSHRNNMMEKLAIHNRSELIKYAIRHGLISTDT